MDRLGIQIITEEVGDVFKHKLHVSGSGLGARIGLQDGQHLCKVDGRDLSTLTNAAVVNALNAVNLQGDFNVTTSLQDGGCGVTLAVHTTREGRDLVRCVRAVPDADNTDHVDGEYTRPEYDVTTRQTVALPAANMYLFHKKRRVKVNSLNTDKYGAEPYTFECIYFTRLCGISQEILICFRYPHKKGHKYIAVKKTKITQKPKVRFIYIKDLGEKVKSPPQFCGFIYGVTRSYDTFRPMGYSDLYMSYRLKPRKNNLLDKVPRPKHNYLRVGKVSGNIADQKKFHFKVEAELPLSSR